MTVLNFYARLIAIVTLVAALVLAFFSLMTIGMTPHGPSFVEAIINFGPIAVAAILAVTAQCLGRTRPALSFALAALGGGVMVWFVNLMAS